MSLDCKHYLDCTKEVFEIAPSFDHDNVLGAVVVEYNGVEPDVYGDLGKRHYWTY